MKAVILVGGEATRLRPLTCNIPKAMVPVVNTPFLICVFRHLQRHGINEIVLTQSASADPIKDYFSDGEQYGVRLHYVREDKSLGTAGAIKNVEEHLEDTCVVMNGDVFTDLDITAMLHFHRQKKAQVTIALTPVDDPTKYGLIETDSDGRITRFLEKPSRDQVTTNMINAGTYIMEPEVLRQIPPERKVSIERETYPLLLASDKPVYAFPSLDYWIDMGTPEKYIQLHTDLLHGKSSVKYLPSNTTVDVGEHCSIHPSAQITGPSVIGNDCIIGQNVKISGPTVIGPDCEIRSDTVIESSIIWQNVILGPSANLRQSIVANDCILNNNCSAEEAVIGDNVTIDADCKLDKCIRIWPAQRVSEDI